MPRGTANAKSGETVWRELERLMSKKIFASLFLAAIHWAAFADLGSEKPPEQKDSPIFAEFMRELHPGGRNLNMCYWQTVFQMVFESTGYIG